MNFIVCKLPLRKLFLKRDEQESSEKSVKVYVPEPSPRETALEDCW